MKRKLRRDKVSIRSLYLQAENLVHFRRGRIVLRQHVITPKRLQVTASHHSRMYCLFTDQIVVRDAKEPLSELGVKLYRLTYLSKRIHTPLGLALNTVTCFCFFCFVLFFCFFAWRQSPQWARSSSNSRLHDHIKTRHSWWESI